MTRSVGGRSDNKEPIGPVARNNSYQPPDNRVRGSSNENKRGNSNEKRGNSGEHKTRGNSQEN